VAAWRSAPTGTKRIEIDLTGLTAVDDAGRRFLNDMNEAGAFFQARGVATKAMVEELGGGSQQRCLWKRAKRLIGTLALVAIGYRALSLAPSAVGPVKAMLLALDAGKAAAFIAPLIDSPVGSVQIRERLKKFAAEQELPI